MAVFKNRLGPLGRETRKSAVFQECIDELSCFLHADIDAIVFH